MEFGLIKCHKGPVTQVQGDVATGNSVLEANNQIAETDTSDDSKVHY